MMHTLIQGPVFDALLYSAYGTLATPESKLDVLVLISTLVNKPAVSLLIYYLFSI